MTIDVHAHFVPAAILDELEVRGRDYGVRLAEVQPGRKCCVIATRDGDAALSADGTFANEGRVSFSYVAHAARVAVDPETGHVEILDYVLAEEIGRALNPMLVEGQAVGGVVQGLGGALFDKVIYDDAGQLLTTTLADYLVRCRRPRRRREFSRTVYR